MFIIVMGYRAKKDAIKLKPDKAFSNYYTKQNETCSRHGSLN